MYVLHSFGFGNVIRQSIKQNTQRFVIQGIQNLYLICLLFNGNIVFPSRKARFTTFLSVLNKKLFKQHIKPILPVDTCPLPTLSDS